MTTILYGKNNRKFHRVRAWWINRGFSVGAWRQFYFNLILGIFSPPPLKKGKQCLFYAHFLFSFSSISTHLIWDHLSPPWPSYSSLTKPSFSLFPLWHSFLFLILGNESLLCGLPWKCGWVMVSNWGLFWSSWLCKD